MDHRRHVSWLASLIHLVTAPRWVLVSRLVVRHWHFERGCFEVLNTVSILCLIYYYEKMTDLVSALVKRSDVVHAHGDFAC